MGAGDIEEQTEGGGVGCFKLAGEFTLTDPVLNEFIFPEGGQIGGGGGNDVW